MTSKAEGKGKGEGKSRFPSGMTNNGKGEGKSRFPSGMTNNGNGEGKGNGCIRRKVRAVVKGGMSGRSLRQAQGRLFDSLRSLRMTGWNTGQCGGLSAQR
jgi:hypothetical protein